MENKFSYAKFFLNAGLSAGGAFIAGYQTTGDAKKAAVAAIVALTTNLFGLFQTPPQAEKK